MTETTRNTNELIDRAGYGDESARRELLDRYRDQLRRMVSAHLDRRLTSRVDASDVVQETLADAARQMDDYLRDLPLPFFGWLRQLAAVRIRETHRRHLFAQRRSITRESAAALSDKSALELGRQFVARDTSPSNRLMRQELREEIMKAVAALPPRDREVLLMRHIERLGMAEIADALGMAEAAVRARHYRALTRLRIKLEGQVRS